MIDEPRERAMPPPCLIPFRDQAREHLAAARVLLAQDGPALRYACLELRLAIEALAYDTLQSYGEDIGASVDKAHGDWQPSRVLAALAEHDPIGEASLGMALYILGPNGERGEPLVQETDVRLSAEWAGKAHSAMGSFLHQRTINQLRSGKAIDVTVLRRKADEVIVGLEAVLASKIPDIRRGMRFGYACPDCDGEISVAMIVLMINGEARTTCESCGAVWRAAGADADGKPALTRMD